jgi:dTDP-4-amino-4,6-dideoxygalactose transaminase
VRTSDRERLAAHLQSRGIFTGMHYPVPVHLQNCHREWGYAEGSLPVTEQAAAGILSLPMFPSLTSAQQERVVAEIQSLTNEASRPAVSWSPASGVAASAAAASPQAK